MLDEPFMVEIRRLGANASYLTSVCTGSLILAAAGLLAGKRAACHWAWRDLLTPFGVIVDEGRVVRDGRIITGGGVTAGIDFAFTVLAELAGEDYAQTVQLGLEYAPQPPFDAGRPELAPRRILEAYNTRAAASAPPPRLAAAQGPHAASRRPSGGPLGPGRLKLHLELNLARSPRMVVQIDAYRCSANAVRFRRPSGTGLWSDSK